VCVSLSCFPRVDCDGSVRMWGDGGVGGWGLADHLLLVRNKGPIYVLL